MACKLASGLALALSVLLLAPSAVTAQRERVRPGRGDGNNGNGGNGGSGSSGGTGGGGSSNCLAGCPVGDLTPVCGADGNTYQNACIAQCQGVTVMANSPCNPNDAALFDTSNGGTNGANSRVGSYSQNDMSRYSGQGFKLVGRGRVDPNYVPQMPVVQVGADRTPQGGRVGGGASPSKAMRFDYATGLMYVTDRPMPLATGGGRFDGGRQAGGGGDASAETGFGSPSTRRLRFILGGDERVRITATTSFPWRAVGQLVFNQGGGTYICSASLIRPNVIITAAHCVHGGPGSGWSSNMRFAPGRNGGTDPYGTIAWSSVVTYSAYATSGNLAYDMAVIKLAQSLPSTHGAFSLLASDSYGPQLLNTAGYPGDKSSQEWYASCTVTDTNPGDQVTENTCDIMGGQSGSPVWVYYSSQNYRGIRGIVSYGTCSWDDGCQCCKPIANFFQQMTTQRVNDANAWAA